MTTAGWVDSVLAVGAIIIALVTLYVATLNYRRYMKWMSEPPELVSLLHVTSGVATVDGVEYVTVAVTQSNDGQFALELRRRDYVMHDIATETRI